MNYCSNCGHSPVSRCIPPGDTRERDVCSACGTIHYENPRNVCGTVPIWEDKILLCRRAIEPRHGFWTLPAGFMELGETTWQCAARESVEEAGAHVDPETMTLFSVLNVPHVDQVHFFYLAPLRDATIAAGEESLEVAFFTEAEIPWDDLAFSTVANTLRYFFEDRRRASYTLHTADILTPMPMTPRKNDSGDADVPRVASPPDARHDAN
ncbi:NUDIX hydrolase [Robbsia andropogonis]|uniref:NUDIX hydrolase n=1 Tax=Robbsia andropogonis TaxID=28092 RepID=UPI0004679306|nr:NUDIX hydrolase [Robbsia andropogonis]MCP1120971.1 NUDIX hydrolase [Robbsia andropogonis]MCP1130748.1 NUDIX hydrolase [Robbsia andropogonis]